MERCARLQSIVGPTLPFLQAVPHVSSFRPVGTSVRRLAAHDSGNVHHAKGEEPRDRSSSARSGPPRRRGGRRCPPLGLRHGAPGAFGSRRGVRGCAHSPSAPWTLGGASFHDQRPERRRRKHEHLQEALAVPPRKRGLTWCLGAPELRTGRPSNCAWRGEARIAGPEHRTPSRGMPESPIGGDSVERGQSTSLGRDGDWTWWCHIACLKAERGQLAVSSTSSGMCRQQSSPQPEAWTPREDVGCDTCMVLATRRMGIKRQRCWDCSRSNPKRSGGATRTSVRRSCGACREGARTAHDSFQWSWYCFMPWFSFRNSGGLSLIAGPFPNGSGGRGPATCRHSSCASRCADEGWLCTSELSDEADIILGSTSVDPMIP